MLHAHHTHQQPSKLCACVVRARVQPTSGLDSTTALKLVHTMRSLASGGRVVIASIHQPSSRLYQQMDKVCECVCV